VDQAQEFAFGRGALDQSPSTEMRRPSARHEARDVQCRGTSMGSRRRPFRDIAAAVLPIVSILESGLPKIWRAARSTPKRAQAANVLAIGQVTGPRLASASEALSLCRLARRTVFTVEQPAPKYCRAAA